VRLLPVSDTSVRDSLGSDDGRAACLLRSRRPGLVALGPAALGPAATILAVSTQRLQGLLETAFPDAAEVKVIDRGGGDHFEVRVTAPAFDGLSRIQQHKLIYAVLDEPWKDGSIHELRINTKGTAQ
jgi:stress-induced morphogen